MFGTSIRSQVLAVIDARIKQGQADYEVGKAKLKEDFNTNYNKLKNDLAVDTDALVSKVVTDVLGPLA